MHFGVGDLDAFGVVIVVQHCLDAEPRRGACATDQVEDGFVRDQWFAAPVDADVREHAVLYLVPLAGARRVVADADLDAQFVRQRLKVRLPGSSARAVRATAVSAEEKTLRSG